MVIALRENPKAGQAREVAADPAARARLGALRTPNVGWVRRAL